MQQQLPPPLPPLLSRLEQRKGECERTAKKIAIAAPREEREREKAVVPHGGNELASSRAPRPTFRLESETAVTPLVQQRRTLLLLLYMYTIYYHLCAVYTNGHVLGEFVFFFFFW